MINVTPGEYQADCHLLEFPDGSKALIDAADGGDAPGVALAFLRGRGIRRLSLVVISHFHMDHYGRLADLVEAGIQIDKVAINLPAKREIADREKPWGMDWDHVQSILELLRGRGIRYFTPQAGERLIDIQLPGLDVRLEVLCAYDGVNTPVGETDVNDTSIILRLQHGSKRALFTGDLNQALGAFLASSEVDLRADVLKVPHHGTEGLPPNEFFDKVSAKAALVPSPKNLWFSPRSMRPRNYFAAMGTPVYVTGIHGHVVVVFKRDEYAIKTARSTK